MNIKDNSDRAIWSFLEKTQIYSSEQFGFEKYLNGSNVSIAIIDSGTPEHTYLPKAVTSADFTEDHSGVNDMYGHATILSGIIAGKEDSYVRGISPEVSLSYAKVLGNNGECSFNAMVAAILWAIIQEVDIILISLGSPTDFSLLHDSVKKAYDADICVIAAAGNNLKIDDEVDFPARYPEVLSVGTLPKGRKKHRKNMVNYGIQLAIPQKEYYTTYLDNKYTTASGSSVASALAAGLVALEIQRRKQNNESLKPEDIFKHIISYQIKLFS